MLCHVSLHLDTLVADRSGEGADKDEENQGKQDCFSPVAAQGVQGLVFKLLVRLHVKLE